MSSEKRMLKFGILVIAFLFIVTSIGVPLANAQYWSAMPPYNLLWPLWSPVFSPVDPITGLATPLLSELTGGTILPVQPVMAWDPAQSFPWLLYNIPPILGGGITFFDPYYGLNPWPPSYLLDPLTGAPAPISLAAGFGALSPTGLTDFGPFVTQGNLSFLATYPTGTFGIPLSNLLTPAQIWGLPII